MTKNTLKAMRNIAGIIATMAVIGFSIVACDSNGGGGDGNSLNGVWVSGSEELTINNNSFDLKLGDIVSMRGTCTIVSRSISGSVTLAVTHLHGDYLEDSSTTNQTFESKWYSRNDLKGLGNTDAQLDEAFPTLTGTYTDTTLTIAGSTYAKQGGGKPPVGGSGNWTVVANSPFTDSIKDIAWGNNKFVALKSVGSAPYIAYSADGINWTATNSTFRGNAVVWGNDKFVAVSSSGIAYSADGINWTVVENALSFPASGVAYGNGKFVAGGGGTTRTPFIAYSTDGINWITANDVTSIFEYPGYFDSPINDICWGGDKFVAVGYDRIGYSSDGINWTAANNPQMSRIYSIAWSGSRFVAVGYNGMAYSTNGVNWTKVNYSEFISGIFSGGYFNSITWGNGRFVTCWFGSARNPSSTMELEFKTVILQSSDGITWTENGYNIFGSTQEMNGIAYGANKFVAVGDSGKMAYWQP